MKPHIVRQGDVLLLSVDALPPGAVDATPAGDVILAVGYRVRSPRGTQLRRWATTVLAEYLVKGFAMDDALLTGVETRTSSPLRIPRGPDRQSLNIAGLYPAGEGAGYAGGIMSAAVDGIETAEALGRHWLGLLASAGTH